MGIRVTLEAVVNLVGQFSNSMRIRAEFICHRVLFFGRKYFCFSKRKELMMMIAKNLYFS